MYGHGMALERKRLMKNEKVKIIQEMENNRTLLQNEIAKHSALPSSSLSNTILWKSSILEEKVGEGHILRNKKH
jgi:hypothetical protein